MSQKPNCFVLHLLFPFQKRDYQLYLMLISLPPMANYGNSNSLAKQMHNYDMKHRIDPMYLMPGQNDISSTYEDQF